MERTSIRLVVFLREFVAECSPQVPSDGRFDSQMTLAIEETAGTETLYEDSDISFYDPRTNFKSDLELLKSNLPDKPTKKVLVRVHEMRYSGQSKELFSRINSNFDKLCLTRAQINKFCKNHRQWLRREGWITLFLVKIANEFFVAHVMETNGHTHAGLDELLRYGVWGDQG